MNTKRTSKEVKLLHFLILSCLLLSGWSWAQGTEPPNVRVVPVYEGQLAFIEALQAEPDLRLTEKTELYQELALAPYAEECASDKEAFIQSNVGYEITKLEAWARAIQDVAEADVADAVGEAVAKAAPLLPAEPITFCVFALHPSDDFVLERMGGVVGAAAATIVYINVYPLEGWLDRLEQSVTHEYHHAAWLQRFPDAFDDFRLLDYLVFEGKASSFAKLVYPEAEAPWTEALTPDQEREQWQALQPYLATRNLDFQRQIMFGNDRFPLWTGYTIGFNVVQAFLEAHPDVSVETWTDMDAQELLQLSGYAP